MNKEPFNSESSSGAKPLVTPLRKVSQKGETYKRPPNIEAKLRELSILSGDTVFRRCQIIDKKLPDYVPSECLLYFVRSTRSEERRKDFEPFYELLLERVLRTLPASEEMCPDGIRLSESKIREGVVDELVELLARDRTGYEVDLDFYEIRFNQALKALRIDVQDRAWREEKKFQSLTWDEETGDLSPDVEKAAGSFDPFAAEENSNENYRLHLNEAINSLPALQRTIIEMLRLGFPIDSKDPNQKTISKTVGKTEKTVRNQRDKAFASLKTMLSGREEK